MRVFGIRQAAFGGESSAALPLHAVKAAESVCVDRPRMGTTGRSVRDRHREAAGVQCRSLNFLASIGILT
jgi:hypothetical protein